MHTEENPMKILTPLTSAALAAFLALAVADANAAGDSMSGGNDQLSQQQQQDFQRLDADHNGQISQDEAQADPQLAKQFSSVDEDSDNNISKGEFARFEAQSQGDQSPGGQSQDQ
jgi:hypothetical protein